ncbi:MAG: hypothetical protein P8Y67_05210 [Alphaproteobacteria bacterium]
MKATQPLGAKAQKWTLNEYASFSFVKAALLRYSFYMAAVILCITQLSGAAFAQDVNLRELKEKGDMAVKLVEQRAADGKDVSDFVIILKVIKTLGQNQRFEEADKLADKVLFLLEIAEKADRALALVEQRASEGRDVSRIVPMLKKVKRLGQSDNFNEANALLDEALDLLEDEKRS